MRVKYNSPSPSHRRVLPNTNPNRVESDPEEWVWDKSNNFVLEIEDSLARELLDKFPGELKEAPPEPVKSELYNPRIRGSVRPVNRDDEAWVDYQKGDAESAEASSGSVTTSKRSSTTKRA